MTIPGDILRGLLASDATRPRLTWYGTDGERIELSARVMDNWVAKAANLLLDEADLGPGGTVRIDLPAGHWRAAYWTLATWSCGGVLRLDDTGADADVLITDDAGRAADSSADVRVLVTPAALARSYPGEVPAGVIDEAAELATYGDRFEPAAEPDIGAPALVAADGRMWSYGALVNDLPVDGVRRHVDASAGDSADRLRQLLTVWAAHGSVVVTTGGGDRLEQLLASESVDEIDE